MKSFLITFVCLLMTAGNALAIKIDFFNCLYGGTAGCLDYWDGSAVSDNDMAVVITQGDDYVCALDEDSGATEITAGDEPIISPDLNAGDKRWLCLKIGSGGTGTGTSTPGGSDTQVQFNDGGVFEGIQNWTTDGSNLLPLNNGDIQVSTTTAGNGWTISIRDTGSNVWRNCFTFENGNPPQIILGASCELYGLNDVDLSAATNYKWGGNQWLDDSKGNGDTGYLWSADKIYDQLNGSIVRFDDSNSDYTATTTGGAIEELVSSNASGPNATDGKVHWDQIVGMPTGFSDGSDDGATGSAGTVNTIQENDVTEGGNDIVTIDFDGDDFIVSETPDQEINVSIDYTNGQKANTLQPGFITELATSGEINTATDVDRAITPYTLAGSYAGQKEIGWHITDANTDTAVDTSGDIGVAIPYSMAGMELVDVTCSVHTAGTTNTTDIQLRRRRSGSDVDMLSTKVTISSGAYTASDESVNTANDDVTTGDIIFVDVDAIHTTPAKGLFCSAVFQQP